MFKDLNRMKRILGVLMITGLLLTAVCKEKPAEKPVAETKAPAAEVKTPDVPQVQAPAPTAPAPEPVKPANPVVVLKTSKGQIKIELFPDKAPISTANFLAYVKNGHYSGTIFHRVIPGFMVQGGGFLPDMKQKPVMAPIKNEATNGLKNDRGTIAMARTNIPDSATSQFFINVVNNAMLNYGGPGREGYAVFGKVIEGMDVVDAIVSVPTRNVGPHGDVPVTPIFIESAAVQ
jgi:cyclophilin family peptidyl-prolyl cis-trans isomerase